MRAVATVMAESDYRCAGAGCENSDNALSGAENFEMGGLAA